MTLKSALLAACGVSAGAPPAATDPYFCNVSLLLNDTGTNGAQNNTFLDSSTNNFTITRNGTPTQGSVTPYWPDGQWSNYFSGSGQYLSVTDNAAFDFGSGDFTIESWVCPTAYNSESATIISKDYGSASPYQPTWRAFLFQLGASGGVYNTLKMIIFNSTTPQTFQTTGITFAIGTWYHVAAVRSGNTMSLYVNGTLYGSGTITIGAINDTAYPVYVGVHGYSIPIGSGALGYFPGYISNLRMVKSTALYTSNFTPSTTPLTAVSGTSLLTCQSNRFKDNSSNNFAITVTGTPTVQAFEPFEPSASYATSVGGSGYFGGSQYLSFTGTNAAFQFGTGDFTVECLVCPTTINTDNYVWDFRPSANGAYPALVMSSTSFQYVANAARVITGTTVPKVGVWYHVVICRSGTSTKLFVNGVQEGSTYSDSTNYTVASNRPYIGIDGFSANTPFIGYIANLRMVKGTAVYTANFTPPTSPVTAITNTSLLLNFTNAGIYDAATLNDLVTVGDAKVSTAQAKWGGSSMAFDGTGDWLTFSDSSTAQLGAGDFTVEGWVYLSTTGTAKYIAAKGTSTTGWAFGINSSNQLVFNYTSSTLTGTTALSSGQWYHVAVVRSGSATGNVKMYLAGVADATSGGAITDNFNQTSVGYVGADRTAANPMNGYIDDLRITKGYARYTANFTPPTAAFPTR